MAKQVSIILLAAGASQRFGQDKLLTCVGGKRLIDWSVKAAVASDLGPVFIVTNPNRKLDDLASVASLIVNPSWHEGLCTSICCGLRALSTTSSHAVIFAPADQPLLTSKVYQRIAERFFQQSAPLIVANYDHKPRNPVLLSHELWEAASRIQGDNGLSMFARSTAAEYVECGDIASIADVDHPADLPAIERLLAQYRLQDRL